MLVWYVWEYSLNNTGLNCVGSIIHGFFPVNDPFLDIWLSSLSKKDTQGFLFRKANSYSFSHHQNRRWGLGFSRNAPNLKQITNLQHCVKGICQILRIPPGLSSVSSGVWRGQEQRWACCGYFSFRPGFLRVLNILELNLAMKNLILTLFQFQFT